jgi:hypothetical protein
MQGVATRFTRDIASQISGRLPGGISQLRSLESCNRINNTVQLSRAKLRVELSEIDKERNLNDAGIGEHRAQQDVLLTDD